MVRQQVEAPARPGRRLENRRPPRPTPQVQQSAQQPLIEEPERQIDGLRVIETHRQQNLPGAPFNYLKLTLEDGSVRYACVDCEDVTGTRDDYRRHRALEHPKETAKVTPGVLALTLGQIISAAENSTAIGNQVEKIALERDHFKAEHAAILRQYTALVKALDKVGFMPKVEEE